MFRHAKAQDLPAIVEIYNQTIPGRMVTADLEPITVESRISWFDSHNPEKRPLLVWEEENTILGWMNFKDFYGRPAYSKTAEVAIYVHANKRRKGLGEKFLEHAITLCPALEITTLLGFIFAHNLPSLKLFKKFGFETWGHLPEIAKLDNDLRDLLILGRKI